MSTVNSIGEPIDPGHSVTVEPSAIHRRVEFAGVVVADSRETLVLTEAGHRTVYFPPSDVRVELLTAAARTAHCPYKGDWHHLHLRSGDRAVRNAAWRYFHCLAERPEIEGYVAFYPGRVDGFLEDGVPV